MILYIIVGSLALLMVWVCFVAIWNNFVASDLDRELAGLRGDTQRKLRDLKRWGYDTEPLVNLEQAALRLFESLDTPKDNVSRLQLGVRASQGDGSGADHPEP